MTRFLSFVLRFLLFLVPLTALGILAFVAVSFIGAQLADVPATPKVALLRSSADQPLDLRPENLERQALGLYLKIRTADLETPAGAETALRPFEIASGETALTVANRLEQEGYITDAGLFRNYMRYNGIDQRLAAGDFRIAKSMTMPEIAEALQRARYEEILVTIPEGMRAEEVAELLDVKGVMDGQAFLGLVRGGSATAQALGGYDWLPAGLATLEGYLFPDTYRLPSRAQPADLARRMLDNFSNRVTDDIVAEARRRGHSLEQTIIMASIVEREAPLADDRPLVASVYWNRLDGRCAKEAVGTYLQADPTVQYAAGRAGQWWWKPTSVEEYQTIQSPYNTYLWPGLPPTAIASPGLSAIQAAAAPAETQYCFFVAAGDGAHVYAATLAEHEANVARYQK